LSKLSLPYLQKTRKVPFSAKRQLTISLANVLWNRLGCRARIVTPGFPDPLLWKTVLSPAVSLSELGNLENDDRSLMALGRPEVVYYSPSDINGHHA
jgi:hypothetical protein